MKYTQTTVNQIICEYNAGESASFLGKKYGIPTKTITRWLKNIGIFLK